MKTVFTFLCLVLIGIVCATSAVLYLQTYYNSSAFLTIVWIISIAYWINANGYLKGQETSKAE
jgi:hypothetical protein